MTTATTETISSTITVKTITAATDTLARVTDRQRRILRDPELPETRDEADVWLRSHLDPYLLIWSRLGAASSLVDEGDEAAQHAVNVHRDGLAYLAALEQQQQPGDTESFAVLEARERAAAESTLFATALVALGAAIEAAADPHRLLTQHVGKAVEVALHLDRDLKRARLRNALERCRHDIAAIRSTQDEHHAIRAQWEARLGREFALSDLPSPNVGTIREGA